MNIIVKEKFIYENLTSNRSKKRYLNMIKKLDDEELTNFINYIYEYYDSLIYSNIDESIKFVKDKYDSLKKEIRNN